MDISIAKLLTTVYELEGLLLVVNKHGDDTPPEVIEALKGKAQAAHELAQQVQWRTAGDTAPCGQPSMATPEESPVGEASAAQPSGCVTEETASEATSCTPPCPTAADEEATVTDEEPADVCDNDPADEPTAAETSEECDKADDSPEDESEAYDSGNDEAQKEEMQKEETQEEDPDEYEEADDDGADEEGLRVDEKLQRTMSKDLRRAFSINDRFRFRRELFANSDIEMRDAIDMVECMHSAEEAEDYFYNDLNWEKTSPEVKDFMEIIKKHFA